MHDTTSRAAQISRTTAAEAAQLADAELDKCLDLLRSLDDDAWSLPTECPGWSVGDVVAHLLGQYQAQANPVLLLRRLRRGRRHHPDLPSLAAHNQQQIDELGALPPQSLIAQLAVAGRRGIHRRSHLPKPLRGLRASRLFPEETLPEDRLDYVMDILGPRDAWMHRIDIADATGARLVVDHVDQALVAQVLRDLDCAWGGPAILLELAGPAGGAWTIGVGPVTGTVRLDAIDCMRLLAGRRAPTLTESGDRAAVAELTLARVVF